MFVFQIKEHLQQRGIKPNYTAFRKMGIAQRTAYKLLDGTAKSISLNHLTKICVYLNCTPKEILRFDVEPDDHSMDNDPLFDWTKRPTAFPLAEFRNMSPEKIERAQAAIRRIIDGEE